MPRFWRNKTGKRRKVVTVESMRAAVLEVVNDGGALRKTADKYEINKQTLSRYIRRYRDSKDIDVITPKYKSTQVFSSDEETTLVEHLKQSSELHNGLNPIQVRQFVYAFALKNNKRFPYQWTTNQAAGSDWYREFMQRNRDLSLGKPKDCSAADNAVKSDQEDWPDYIDVSVLVKEEIITDSSASSTHSEEGYSTSELPATPSASQVELRCSVGRTNGTASPRDAPTRNTSILNPGQDECDMFLKCVAKQYQALKKSSSKQKLQNGILQLMMEVQMEDNDVAGPSHDGL